MDSARDAAAASDAVILPRPWATLRESPPGWLYPSGFKLGVGKAFEGPFAEIFDPSNETEKLLVQVSQLDWSQVRQAARMPRCLARSTICFPEEPVQLATTQETLVEASQLLLWFMCVCVAQQAAQMLRSLTRSTNYLLHSRAFIGGACAGSSD